MNDAAIIIQANIACPGHQHRIKQVRIKSGGYDPITNKYVEQPDSPSTFGDAELECLLEEKKP